MQYPTHLATGNKNKLKEFNEILGLGLEQIDVELLEPQAVDVADVVREKAKDAYLKTNKAVLVEDTGLSFDAWNGLPGALIKWFLHTVNNEGILKMLESENNRKAQAKTVVGYFDGVEYRLFEGTINGSISREVRGENGFGWDKIFIPDGYEKTFGEMDVLEKNKISMRKVALEKLRAS